MMRPYSEQRPVYSIVSILIGIFIMLIGMMVVHSFGSGLWTSYADIIPVAIGLFYTTRALGLKKYVGQRSVGVFIVSTCILIVFSIWFSNLFVFNSAEPGELSAHIEHDWAYQQILAIAESIKNGEGLSEALSSLNLRQYQNTFAYSSLMFLFGGDEVTHICVWCGMHVAVIALLTFLIAQRMGISDAVTLRFILFAAFLQPVFCAIYIYHRDTIGEAFLLLGVYIFICNYKNPLRCLLFLPLYGFLFYSFRLQYLTVAFFLCFWTFLHKAEASSITTIVLFFIAVIAISAVSNSISALTDDLNFGNYLDGGASKLNKGLFRTIFIGLFGYFPWTNLLKDLNWSYHYLICLQSVVNIGLWYNFIKAFKGRWYELWHDPITICAVILTSFGFAAVGHVTYISVGIPLFVSCIRGMKFSELMKQYGVIFIIFFVISIIYNALGLTGSGGF